MLKLPPTSALMVVAVTVAPMTLVSPPLFIVAVLPAETLVFVKLVSYALLLPLPLLDSFFVAAGLNRCLHDLQALLNQELFAPVSIGMAAYLMG